MSALHLIPVALAEVDPAIWLPAEAIAQAQKIKHWIVENAKPARSHIARFKPNTPIQQQTLHELSAKTSAQEIDAWLQDIKQGCPVGLMSDAGCPAVADPGARVVTRAHALGLQVMPWVGPSSILLALMASGLEGQRFRFHGYLASDEQGRCEQLRAIERESASAEQTELWIETPYRNTSMWASCLRTLHAETRLGYAQDLTGLNQHIAVQRIEQWRMDLLHKGPDARIPAVFMLLAHPSRRQQAPRPSATPAAPTARPADPKRHQSGGQAARRRSPRG